MPLIIRNVTPSARKHVTKGKKGKESPESEDGGNDVEDITQVDHSHFYWEYNRPGWSRPEKFISKILPTYTNYVTKAIEELQQQKQQEDSSSSESESEADERYDVEQIVKHEIDEKDGDVKLRVGWRNYDRADDTWEPIENVVNAGEIVDSYLVTEVLTKQKKTEEFDHIAEKLWEGKKRKRFALGRGLVDADVSDDEKGESKAGTAIGDFLQHMAMKAEEREQEEAKRSKKSASAGPSSAKKSKKA